jgi:hypothetical protein
MAQKGDKHKQKTTYHRRRDTVFAEKTDFAVYKVADQQKNCRHSDGHNGVGTDLKDIVDGFKSHSKKYLPT